MRYAETTRKTSAQAHKKRVWLHIQPIYASTQARPIRNAQPKHRRIFPQVYHLPRPTPSRRTPALRNVAPCVICPNPSARAHFDGTYANPLRYSKPDIVQSECRIKSYTKQRFMGTLIFDYCYPKSTFYFSVLLFLLPASPKKATRRSGSPSSSYIIRSDPFSGCYAAACGSRLAIFSPITVQSITAPSATFVLA